MTPRRRFLHRFLTIGLALAAGLATGPLAPPAVAAGRLTAAQMKTVHKVEAYLNGIDTLQSRFIQISSTGDYSEGKLYLDRPGRIRIEYDPPNPTLLIANGEYLSVYDKDVDQNTFIAVDQTPAEFLLRKTIRFDPAEVVIHDVEDRGGLIRMAVGKRDDPFGGTLTLIFRANPMTLKKWSVVDAQGNVTDISLTDSFFGAKLDPSLFEFVKTEDTTTEGG